MNRDLSESQKGDWPFGGGGGGDDAGGRGVRGVCVAAVRVSQSAVKLNGISIYHFKGVLFCASPVKLIRRYPSNIVETID